MSPAICFIFGAALVLAGLAFLSWPLSLIGLGGLVLWYAVDLMKERGN